MISHKFWWFIAGSFWWSYLPEFKVTVWMEQLTIWYSILKSCVAICLVNYCDLSNVSNVDCLGCLFPEDNNYNCTYCCVTSRLQDSLLQIIIMLIKVLYVSLKNIYIVQTRYGMRNALQLWCYCVWTHWCNVGVNKKPVIMTFDWKTYSILIVWRLIEELHSITSYLFGNSLLFH